jgi:uncharacterized membrane protein
LTRPSIDRPRFDEARDHLRPVATRNQEAIMVGFGGMMGGGMWGAGLFALLVLVLVVLAIAALINYLRQ